MLHECVFYTTVTLRMCLNQEFSEKIRHKLKKVKRSNCQSKHRLKNFIISSNKPYNEIKKEKNLGIQSTIANEVYSNHHTRIKETNKTHYYEAPNTKELYT